MDFEDFKFEPSKNKKEEGFQMSMNTPPPLRPQNGEELIEACAEDAAQIVSQTSEVFASIKKNFQASLRKGEALRKKNRNGARRTNGDAFLL